MFKAFTPDRILVDLAESSAPTSMAFPVESLILMRKPTSHDQQIKY